MNIKQKQMDKLLSCIVYWIIFLAFQLFLYIYVILNQCEQNYLGLIFFQLLIGIVGIFYVRFNEGNVKLVLYVTMLLSIGQLLQALLQTGEDYIKYQQDYQKFMTIAIIAFFVLTLLYRRFFEVMYSWKMQIIVCAAAILIPPVLRVFGEEQNGAWLWIRIGGISFQLTELLKPLLIFAVAGFLCKSKKVSDKRLLLTLIFIGIISCLCVWPINEFGTGIVLGLTGAFMIYIFQNTKFSKVIAGVTFLVITMVISCYHIGNYLCERIPMLVSDEIFAEQFLGYSYGRDEWADFVEEYMKQLSEEELVEKEAKMNQSYVSMIEYVRREVGDLDIRYAYLQKEDLVKDKNYTSEAGRHAVMNYMSKLLACDIINDSYHSFRESFYEEFLDGEIQKDRILGAYEAQWLNESTTTEAKDNTLTDNSFQPIIWNTQLPNTDEDLIKLIKKPIVHNFLKIYLPLAEKIQDKFVGYLDPEGEKNDNAQHVNTTLAAMSTGGFWGNGPKVNTGDFFASDSDMAFGMIIAELGYLIGIITIILCLLVFQEMIMIGISTPYLYQKGICIGCGVCWVVQSLLIIGANCRLVPFAGITLPLISTGGTSLLVSLLMALLVVLISVHPISKKRNRMKPLNKKSSRKKSKAKVDAEDEFFEDVLEEKVVEDRSSEHNTEKVVRSTEESSPLNTVIYTIEKDKRMHTENKHVNKSEYEDKDVINYSKFDFGFEDQVEIDDDWENPYKDVY